MIVKPKQVAVLALFFAFALLPIAAYLRAVASSVAREGLAACAAFEAEPIRLEAPDFSLLDLQGKRQRLSELRGKVVLLNFWATWCPPCVEELPSLVALRRLLVREDFALITVNVDESAAVLGDFFAKQKDRLETLPVLLDSSRRVPASYGTTKFPETFLIDRQGVARYKFIYKRDWSTPAARACILSLL
jgi:thiol-disulfide isomerase/thioredoxin